MISLCMIVKNEEDNLDRCLKSAQDIADEIIIVDTGSTDSTVQIAKKYTSNVYFYKWNNDFSAARNFSLSKANGDWILILDADDEVPDKYINDIKALTKDYSIDVYIFNTLNLIHENDTKNLITNLNPRLFQNKSSYKYEGSVHNQLISVIKKVNPDAVIKIVPIDIYHYGYLQSNVIKQNKRERNMKILHRQLKKNPQDIFAIYNMGNEYYSLNNMREALNYYLKVYNTISPTSSIYPRLILRMISCCLDLKLYDDIYLYADTALKYYPSFTDLYYLRGYSNRLLCKPTAAVCDLKKALELGKPHPTLAYYNGAGTYKSAELLCKIYFDFEDYKNCLNSCIELLKYPETTNIKTIKILVHCLYKLRASKKEIEKAIKIVLNNNKNNRFIYASNILIIEKDFNLSLKYVNKGLQDLYSKNMDESLKKSLINTLKYYKGVCEFNLKDYEKSIETLTNIDGKELLYYNLPYILLSGIIIQDKNAIEFSISKNCYTSKVCKCLYNILDTNKFENLAEDEKESVKYEKIIFTILEILLDIEAYSKFEKALSLLDLIKSNDTHLRLGKLYYKYGKFKLCKKELMLSISINNVIDEKGSRILSSICVKDS